MYRVPSKAGVEVLKHVQVTIGWTSHEQTIVFLLLLTVSVSTPVHAEFPEKKH